MSLYFLNGQKRLVTEATEPNQRATLKVPMKFISFETTGSSPTSTYGVWQDEHTWLAAPSAFLAQYADLKSVVAAGQLPALYAAATQAQLRLSPQQARLLPVIPNPGKIFCVGLNYTSHVAEMKRADSEYPAIFTRFADSLNAHNAPLRRSSQTQRFDYEGELAIIIGKAGRMISQASAMAHIAGYACFNDATARDWQRHTHQWTPGKNFPATGALGPFMASADSVGDVSLLDLQTRLNGQIMQSARLSQLIFTIPRIIEYVSSFTQLSPGDVIATGTPGGVGDKREPPVYMVAGDVIEVEISGLGILRNTVTQAAQ